MSDAGEAQLTQTNQVDTESLSANRQHRRTKEGDLRMSEDTSAPLSLPQNERIDSTSNLSIPSSTANSKALQPDTTKSGGGDTEKEHSDSRIDSEGLVCGANMEVIQSEDPETSGGSEEPQSPGFKYFQEAYEPHRKWYVPFLELRRRAHPQNCQRLPRTTLQGARKFSMPPKEF